ncbi:MAG: ribonucleoside triphosphate reductase, partial [Clostridia bacterium]|nr:ribonucleoside triphosphate reductase [Clostridia bacterium]
MFRVKKRDGSVVDFNLEKIRVAIINAFNATEKPYNDDVIDMLALKVNADFTPKIKGGVIDVEDIQD